MIIVKEETTPNTHLTSASPAVVGERVDSRPNGRPTCTIDVQQHYRDVVERLHND